MKNFFRPSVMFSTVGLFENVVLDSSRTIKLQICPDRGGLYAFHTVLCIHVHCTCMYNHTQYEC